MVISIPTGVKEKGSLKCIFTVQRRWKEKKQSVAAESRLCLFMFKKNAKQSVMFMQCLIS